MQPNLNRKATERQLSDLRSPISGSNESLEQAVPRQKRAPRFRLKAPEPRPGRSSYATHKQLVKIAHGILQDHGTVTDIANLVDMVKAGCAKWGLTWRDPREITKAIESAVFQRRFCRR